METAERLVVLRTGSPRYAPAVIDLAQLHADRFNLRRDRADSDAAVRWFEIGVAAVEPTERRAALVRLGTVLRRRHVWSGQSADFAASVDFWTKLLAATPEVNADHLDWLGGLAAVLIDRYEHDGSITDLDAAVATVDRTIAAVGVEMPVAQRRRLNDIELAVVSRRCRATGRPDDLDRLLRLSRHVLDEADPGTARGYRQLATDHAFFLIRRFNRVATKAP